MGVSHEEHAARREQMRRERARYEQLISTLRLITLALIFVALCVFSRMWFDNHYTVEKTMIQPGQTLSGSRAQNCAHTNKVLYWFMLCCENGRVINQYDFIAYEELVLIYEK